MPELSQEDFAELARLALLEVDGAPAEITFNPDSFSLEIATDAGDLSILLTAYYQQATAKHSTLNVALDRLVAAYREVLRTAEQRLTEGEFVPAIRSRAWSGLSVSELPVPFRPLADVLALIVVVDGEATLLTLSEALLEQLGATFDSVLHWALEVLKQKPTTIQELRPGLHAFSTGDSFDSSRLLLTELIEAVPATGTRVAMVPCRDALLVADSEDPDALLEMADVCEQLLEDRYVISGYAFSLVEGEWRPWLPVAPSLRARFEHLRRLTRAGEYAEQRDRLRETEEFEEEVGFLADYMLVGTGAESTSIASWGEDVLTLLPEADVVALGYLAPAGSKMTLAPMSLVQEVVPHRLVGVDVYPPRWRTVGFPTKKELREIARRSKGRLPAILEPE